VDPADVRWGEAGAGWGCLAEQLAAAAAPLDRSVAWGRTAGTRTQTRTGVPVTMDSRERSNQR
jgi:hypothetical protein